MLYETKEYLKICLSNTRVTISNYLKTEIFNKQAGFLYKID